MATIRTTHTYMGATIMPCSLADNRDKGLRWYRAVYHRGYEHDTMMSEDCSPCYRTLGEAKEAIKELASRR